MTIRNLDRFIESIQDWAILDGCFGNTRIRPSDIDGFVERRGQCLFLEGKGTNAPLTTGQAIAYSTLAKQGNTVIVFWGKDSNISKMRVITPDNSGIVKTASLQDLRNTVSEWYAKANNERTPHLPYAAHIAPDGNGSVPERSKAKAQTTDGA